MMTVPFILKPLNDAICPQFYQFYSLRVEYWMLAVDMSLPIFLQTFSMGLKSGSKAGHNITDKK